MSANWLKAALIASALIGLPSRAAAQISIAGDGPIHIKAETSTYEGDEVRLIGDVVVTQNVSKIYADNMTIYRQPNPSTLDATNTALATDPRFGTVTRIVATGHFRYVGEDTTVKGNKGEYFRISGKIVVSGNVEVIQKDGSKVSGSELVYDIKNNVTLINGSCHGANCKSGRVNFRVNQ